MLLHKTALFELHFDPATDVMRLAWPDVKEADRSEIEHSFQLIRDSIKAYFITRLLIDSRQTSHLPDKELLQQVAARFMLALSGTGLKKVARLQSLTPEREALTAEVTKKVTPASNPIDFRNFTHEAEALEWLMQ